MPSHTLSALLLTCPPIPHVRIGLVGLGQRGMKTLSRYADIEGAEICGVADLCRQKVEEAADALAVSSRKEPFKLWGEEAWKEMCARDDVDLVYVCTEWNSHCRIAVEAMTRGKHVAVEVPAATTVEECRLLVSTAEQTRRHCFMTENCCYDFFTLQTLEMHRRGLFGQITHCEGAYIHDLTRPASTTAHGMTDTRHNWIEHSCATHGGNPYPTHAIGPIARLLGIHRNDRFSHLVSLTAKGGGSAESPIGRVNNTLIATEKGVTILLQLDVTTHRPYSRLQTICGTEGFARKYPVPTIQIGPNPCLTGKAALDFMKQFSSSPSSKLWEEGHARGVPNEMNYAMDARLIRCLNQGLPLDIDVYDAAEWSCLSELTRLSATQGGKPVEIPRFL